MSYTPDFNISPDIDQEYVAYLNGLDIETRAALERDINRIHATCSIDNPFGLCGECQRQYDMGYQLGVEDFFMGVALLDGITAWQAAHPEIPRVGNGAIEGYAHGYAKGMVRSILRPTAALRGNA
jgi:hypothetical protein